MTMRVKRMTTSGKQSAGWLLPAGFVALILALILALPWVPALADRSGYYGMRVDLPAAQLPPSGGSTAVSSERGLDVVFFGYHHCGTVCPLQLTNLMQLSRQLADVPVRFVFVTLDPERDTPEVLDAVMANLGDSFRAVRPQTGYEARQLASRYHDYAARTGTGLTYDFDHSGHLHVVSARGRRELLYTTPELDLDRVGQDLRRLLSELRLYPEYARL